MTLSATEWKQQILLEVGAGLDGSSDVERAAKDVITYQIDTLWEMWGSKNYFPRLQYLYTKRACIDTLMGQLRTTITRSIGPLSMNLDSYLSNLSTLRQNVDNDIKQAESSARQRRPSVVKMTEATAAIQPENSGGWPPGVPGPGSPRYRGSPFGDT